MPDELRLDFDVLTPLFLGGARQDVPELRAPSVKGLLRFWYRAADPSFMTWEPRLFGGAGDGRGQSGVLLRIDSPPLRRRLTWEDFAPRRFNRGSGRETRNGLVYLGFPFQMRGGPRQAIPPGHGFAVRCLLPRRSTGAGETGQRLRRALAAAAWLLGHFGGAGSRSRRGFGALSLRRWTVTGDDWPDLDALLPLTATASDAEDARTRLRRGLATVADWFGSEWDDNEHPHLGGRFRFRLLDAQHPRDGWDAALAAMGERMQAFRLRRAPDYQMVKDHVLATMRQGGAPLTAAPDRACFGLPLTFRYSSVRAGRPITIVPYNARERTTHERHGSLLFLRPLAVGDRLHPLYCRLDGAVPGQSPPAAPRGQGRPLKAPGTNAMDAFLDSLPTETR